MIANLLKINANPNTIKPKMDMIKLYSRNPTVYLLNNTDTPTALLPNNAKGTIGNKKTHIILSYKVEISLMSFFLI